MVTFSSTAGKKYCPNWVIKWIWSTILSFHLFHVCENLIPRVLVLNWDLYDTLLRICTPLSVVSRHSNSLTVKSVLCTSVSLLRSHVLPERRSNRFSIYSLEFSTRRFQTYAVRVQLLKRTGCKSIFVVCIVVTSVRPPGTDLWQTRTSISVNHSVTILGVYADIQARGNYCLYVSGALLCGLSRFLVHRFLHFQQLVRCMQE